MDHRLIGDSEFPRWMSAIRASSSKGNPYICYQSVDERSTDIAPFVSDLANTLGQNEQKVLSWISADIGRRSCISCRSIEVIVDEVFYLGLIDPSVSVAIGLPIGLIFADNQEGDLSIIARQIVVVVLICIVVGVECGNERIPLSPTT